MKKYIMFTFLWVLFTSCQTITQNESFSESSISINNENTNNKHIYSFGNNHLKRIIFASLSNETARYNFMYHDNKLTRVNISTLTLDAYYSHFNISEECFQSSTYIKTTKKQSLEDCVLLQKDNGYEIVSFLTSSSDSTVFYLRETILLDNQKNITSIKIDPFPYSVTHVTTDNISNYFDKNGKVIGSIKKEINGNKTIWIISYNITGSSETSTVQFDIGDDSNFFVF